MTSDLSISGARDSNADGTGGAVSRQAYDSHIVTEVLAAKLCTNAHLASE